ncbi:MAG: biotin/lipoyl-containing protein, partial [Comamonas sp.]|uniref:biotin/lipoyl-containing protein n=1 Tax=Comamonas sp. TaxID=34028 RepID=UPI002FC5A5B2
MALTDIKVPDIGDFSEVGVIEVLVKVGDTIKVEQSLLTVESDKASMEIPSSHAGVVKEIKVALGDKVKEGSVIVVLETAEAAPAPAPAAAAPVAAAAPAPVAAAPVAAAPVAAAPAASSTVDLKIPDIGDFKDVAVIEMLVKVGDTVTLEQSLFTVESDKASMEIPSPSAGTITALSIKLGDTVNIGDVVGQITVQGAAPAAAPVQAAAPAAAVVAAPVAAPVAAAPVAAAPVAAAAHNPTVAPSGKLPHASPSVRKFARELGVPLAEVKGSGQKGRITTDDIQAFTKSVMAGAVQTLAQQATAPKSSGGNVGGLEVLAWPKVDFAKFGPVE